MIGRREFITLLGGAAALYSWCRSSTKSQALRDSSPTRTRTVSRSKFRTISARSPSTPCACGKSYSIY
jgi:hypothetical protein